MTQIKTDKKRIRSAQISFFRVLRVPFFKAFIGLSILLSSCSSGPYPGYTSTSDGYYYKLIRFGEKEMKIKETNVVSAEIKMFDREGKPYRNEGNFGKIVFDASGGIPGMGTVIFLLSEGDSVSIQAPESELGTDIRSEIKIIRVQTQEEYYLEQKHIAEVGDYDEHNKLQDYLKENKITEESINNGLYILPIEAGKGDSVKAGKTVQISYKGYFLNGREFDATKPNEPLEFVYGTEMQVIDGLRMAVGRMREGQKSKIIIPSHFAFGEKGSSTGVVPPFTTLIYEVEIINVK